MKNAHMDPTPSHNDLWHRCGRALVSRLLMGRVFNLL